MSIIRLSLLIIAGVGLSAGVAVSQQDWNSGCLNMDPEACGQAIWQSYAGADPVGNALNGSIDDVIGGGFDHKTPEEIAACIQKCEDHRRESVGACRMVYGSSMGDADHCISAVNQSYAQCVQQCNN